MLLSSFFFWSSMKQENDIRTSIFIIKTTDGNERRRKTLKDFLHLLCLSKQREKKREEKDERLFTIERLVFVEDDVVRVVIVSNSNET